MECGGQSYSRGGTDRLIKATSTAAVKGQNLSWVFPDVFSKYKVIKDPLLHSLLVLGFSAVLTSARRA